MQRSMRLAPSMETERGQGTPPRLRRIAQYLDEFGLGAGIVRRCQPAALQLAIVSAFQPLAELLGAIAFLRPPHQDAQARRSPSKQTNIFIAPLATPCWR